MVQTLDAGMPPDSETASAPAGGFADMLARVRSGCPVATEHLVAQYGKHILRVVRRRLSRRLRSEFDSIDIAQDVWAAVFADPQPLAKVDSPDKLATYLAAIARNKVVHQYRRRLQSTSRRKPPVTSLNEMLAGGGQQEAERALGRDASPSQVVMAREAWERIIDANSPAHRRMLRLLRDGETRKRVARQVGVNPRTLIRAIAQASARKEIS